MSKRKVVLTGAAGYVAGRMLPALRERYDLTLIDIKTTNRAGEQVEGVVVVNLCERDRDTYREHFRGADAVVHCGFTRAADACDRFWAELDNVRMAYNMYQTCLEERVRRVVVIGSNHAADYYERLIWKNLMGYVTPDMRPLSDNYYGWAKAAYELLGFVFASGGAAQEEKLQNVQIRIGAPREIDFERLGPQDLNQMHRALGAYLSVRDQVQLVVKSIETEHIEDEHGVPFQIFYGISGNTHAFWSVANARRVIGYAPCDDSQVRFAPRIAEILDQAQNRQQ